MACLCEAHIQKKQSTQVIKSSIEITSEIRSENGTNLNPTYVHVHTYGFNICFTFFSRFFEYCSVLNVQSNKCKQIIKTLFIIL
jgi:hypothetical protein